MEVSNHAGIKKGFLVVAHGSRKAGANERVFGVVERLRNFFRTELFEAAFMELASPPIDEGVKRLVKKGVDELVVFPFFLFNGMHSSRDVPRIVRETLDEINSGVRFKMLGPLGMHPAISGLVEEIFLEEAAGSIEFERVAPSMIESRSMEIIEAYFAGREVPGHHRAVVKRVIHTTGDFDFLRTMVFHDRAINEGLKAVREKKTIYTDVTMVQAGINRRFGHDVRCVLNEPGLRDRARAAGMTGAAWGIKTLGGKLDGNIVVVGNAPTALITLVDMIKKGDVRPSLIVGTPVGFVNARESKEYLMTLEDVPFITNRGRKGGSTVAAAIINALIKMEFKDP